MSALLLLIQLIISALFTGLVWLVQLTHYPAFHFIDKELWQSFHQFHSSSISIMAMPLMLCELALAVYGLWIDPSVWSIAAGSLVAIIWGNTFLQAVPLHGALAAQKDKLKIKKLVRVNSIRTIASTARTCILAYLCFQLMTN